MLHLPLDAVCFIQTGGNALSNSYVHNDVRDGMLECLSLRRLACKGQCKSVDTPSATYIKIIIKGLAMV